MYLSMPECSTVFYVLSSSEGVSKYIGLSFWSVTGCFLRYDTVCAVTWPALGVADLQRFSTRLHGAIAQSLPSFRRASGRIPHLPRSRDAV